MSTTVAIILIAVILLAAVAAWAFLQRRSTTLRRRFGPEYDRALGEYGNRLRAEQALERRAERT